MTVEAQHGLAGTIRSSTESDTFDLGGLTASTIANVVENAFQDPFSLEGDNEMIRVTLVVGAGKQARQKYDAQAIKTVTTTLQSVGFVEDRGASCIAECAGMYKLQHDTGKNLKTIVVFPKITTRRGNGDNYDGDDDMGGSSSNANTILAPSSLEYRVATCTMASFENLVQHKLASWSQKKALVHLIDEEILARINEYDRLLMQGQPLTDPQQAFYDVCTQVAEKREYVQDKLHTQVQNGQLTSSERDQLLAQVQHRLDELKAQNKPKLVAKTKERQSKLKDISPIAPPPLKHYVSLSRLWKQLKPLDHIDASGSSGKLLSVQETKLVGQKLNILEEIDELEEASREMLEDDATFETRRLACRRELQYKYAVSGTTGSGKSPNKKKASGGGGGSRTISSSTKVRVPATTKWVVPTPGMVQSKAQKKKARMKKGDVFGAMMMDDGSSDEENDDNGSDDSDDDDDEQDDSPASQTAAETSNNDSNNATTGASNTAASANKKNAPKKNKKKNKKKKNDNCNDTPTPTMTGKEKGKPTAAAENKNNSLPMAVVYLVLWLLKDVLLPCILAILNFLVSLFAGKKQPSKQKKK